MATVASPVHPFEAARQAGREPFKVKDLSLAEFGRKVLYSTERPSFSELEAHVKQKKA